MALDFYHCFRKTFTGDIYRKLAKGDSINLIGSKLTGRQRLLDDLALLARQEGFTPVSVDMKQFTNHYEGFVRQVQDQLILTHGIERELFVGETSLSSLSENTVVSSSELSIVLSQQLPEHQRIFLLVNNFDYLLDNPSQRFPKTFFDDLNSIRHKQGISLCVVTKQSHLKSYIHYKAEDGDALQSTLSWLDLEPIDLPSPTIAEVREELNKRLERVLLWQEENEKERFVAAVSEHTAPYCLLKIIENSFTMGHDRQNADRRLSDCYLYYRKNYADRPRENSWRKLLLLVKSLIEWSTDQLAKVFHKKQ